MNDSSTQPALYFAYGSNLEPIQMAHRAPGHRVVGRAVLRDHELRFRGYGRDWAGAVATIEPAPGRVVHGVVFAITPAHYDALDHYEGYDGPGAATNVYDRVPARVEMEGGGGADVLTYRMTLAPEGAPSRRYRDAILTGMRHHGMPAAAIEALEQVPTAD